MSGTRYKGELNVDSNGELFHCQADSFSAAPFGTWKKVSLQESLVDRSRSAG